MGTRAAKSGTCFIRPMIEAALISSEWPAASKAPSMAIPEMAFEADMSGV